MSDNLVTSPTQVVTGTPKERRATKPAKYPGRFNCRVPMEMALAIGRNSALISEGDIGRLALHNWLYTNDPVYARAVGGKRG